MREWLGHARTFALGVLAIGALVACNSHHGGDHGTSETHFLRPCTASCEDGYSCLCGVCTLACDDDAACKAQGNESATCGAPEADRNECGGVTKLCDLRCAGDGDCRAVGAEFGCEAGRCRARASMADGGVTAGRGAGSGGRSGSAGAGSGAGAGSSVGGSIAPMMDAGVGPVSDAGANVDAGNMPVGSGTACEVNGTVYPSGTDGIDDPQSCNKCICNQGQLACTEIFCPEPCPAGTKYAVSCSQCGPADGCEILRSGCLPTCETSEDCTGDAPPFCFDGVCRILCG